MAGLLRYEGRGLEVPAVARFSYEIQVVVEDPWMIFRIESLREELGDDPA
jgi:hypothetical protein